MTEMWDWCQVWDWYQMWDWCQVRDWCRQVGCVGLVPQPDVELVSDVGLVPDD